MSQKIVYAFIDAQNLYLAFKYSNRRLDFKKFRVMLSHRFRVTTAFLYIGYISTNIKLYDKLEKDGFVLRFKPVVMMRPGKVKGNVDSELIVDALWHKYSEYDSAVFVSGDGDYICLYSVLQSEGKLSKIIVPSYKSMSSLLSDFNRYVYILEWNNKVFEDIGGRTPSSRRY